MKLSILARNTEANATIALLAGGKLCFYTGAAPGTPQISATGTLLVTGTLGTPAAPSASSGVATMNAIASGVAVANGTVGYARQYESDGTTAVADFSVGLTGSGADIIVDDVVIVLGVTISFPAYTYSRPQ